MNKFDLGWGEPVCVREVLNKLYTPSLAMSSVVDMSYAPDDGHAQLIELVEDYILETTGKTYQHIIITNGTTPAINTVLRTLKRYEGAKKISTSPLYFPYYPEIIKKNGLEQVLGHTNKTARVDGEYKLIDMPSNPTGSMSQSYFNYFDTIWDSVYYNPVYINSPRLALKAHRVMVGSLSKVLGLTGLRIGWIATDSEMDYKRYTSDNLHESCTISVPSQELAIDILENVNRRHFFRQANTSVNYNRESLNRIKHLFDGQEVQNNGMFYGVFADDKATKILEKANVSYVTLTEDGQRNFIRFNLGQNNLITEHAVKAVLKADGVR